MSNMDEDLAEDILMREPNSLLTFRLRCRASSIQHLLPSLTLQMTIYPLPNLLITKVLVPMAVIELEAEAVPEALTSRDVPLARCSRYQMHKL